jgi:hypothetical protein
VHYQSFSRRWQMDHKGTLITGNVNM